jgi:hypothetical protein
MEIKVGSKVMVDPATESFLTQSAIRQMSREELVFGKTYTIEDIEPCDCDRPPGCPGIVYINKHRICSGKTKNTNEYICIIKPVDTKFIKHKERLCTNQL